MEERMKKKIIELIIELYRVAETKLPDDVISALRSAYEKESNRLAKSILSAILKNIELSEELNKPMCQDTGVPTFYLEVGEKFPIKHELRELIMEATRLATAKVPLRPNAVDPFTGNNTGDNTGRFIPYIHWDFVEGNNLKITLLPKGGGSENTVQLRMISPGLGLEGVKHAVIEAIYDAGGKPCPPVIVGIGIGGGSDIALSLAKKAILRPITERHRDRLVAKFESELLDYLNRLGIGPMGLGGDTTVLGVNIEYAHRHPASMPIGIVTQCWAARRASVTIDSRGNTRWISHREVDLYD
jgi:fumarate hydratase subunit alpha